MERNAQYVSEIIRRLQEPLKDEEQVDVNINGMLDEVVKRETERDPDSFHNVTVQFEPDPRIPLIKIGIGQVSEVFRNMVGNAVRAMRPQGGGTLRITSHLADQEIEVRVSDTGLGIPPNILGRLFKKPVPPRDFGAGAGLGLWLSKLIFQRYGGTIKVEDTGTGGTTILAILPTSHP
jgi:signal transduction histidine kinase